MIRPYHSAEFMTVFGRSFFTRFLVVFFVAVFFAAIASLHFRFPDLKNTVKHARPSLSITRFTHPSGPLCPLREDQSPELRSETSDGSTRHELVDKQAVELRFHFKRQTGPDRDIDMNVAVWPDLHPGHDLGDAGVLLLTARTD